MFHGRILLLNAAMRVGLCVLIITGRKPQNGARATDHAGRVDESFKYLQRYRLVQISDTSHDSLKINLTPLGVYLTLPLTVCTDALAVRERQAESALGSLWLANRRYFWHGLRCVSAKELQDT